MQETGPDPEHLYNCHVIVDAEGRIAAQYRKVHLFNVEVENGPVLMESRFTTPGQQVRLLEPACCSIHVAVCAMQPAVPCAANSQLCIVKPVLK